MADLNAGKTNEGTLLQRGLFLVGEHDIDGSTVNEILAIKDAHERAMLMFGRLGALVGADQESDAVTMDPVTTRVENLP